MNCTTIQSDTVPSIVELDRTILESHTKEKNWAKVDEYFQLLKERQPFISSDASNLAIYELRALTHMEKYIEVASNLASYLQNFYAYSVEERSEIAYYLLFSLNTTEQLGTVVSLGEELLSNTTNVSENGKGAIVLQMVQALVKMDAVGKADRLAQNFFSEHPGIPKKYKGEIYKQISYGYAVLSLRIKLSQPEEEKPRLHSQNIYVFGL